MTTKNKILVGALEQCDLPELGIFGIHARVDTGATTSSLHVDNIEEFKKNNRRWVTFDIHPDIHNVSQVIRVSAPLKGKKTVKSSSADRQRRLVIETLVRFGEAEWKINITLSDRAEMSYLMLLGREAMKNRIIVDPSHDYLFSNQQGSG